jgi:hypothetical protein
VTLVTLNPYQSPQIPPELHSPPAKKRPSDLMLFLSAFKPLLWFVAVLFFLSGTIVVFDLVWMLFYVRS